MGYIKGFKDIKDIVSQYGFNLLSVDNKKIIISDKEGYYYKPFLSDICIGKKPHKFISSNPYVIYNIKKYIIDNGINAMPLFNTYKNNTEKLKWKCSCGNEFFVSWNKFRNGQCMCKNCGIINGKNKVYKNIREDSIRKLESDGYIILQFNDMKNIHIKDNSNYKYVVNFTNYSKGYNPRKFGKSNPYTIDNLNNFFKLERNSEYLCKSNNYTGNFDELKFIHTVCNTEFASTLSYMTGKINSIGKFSCGCPKCVNHRKESYHASILKQVFMHEYPDTVCEDRTCINPKTKYVLPTDIVNHNLKIAIEIQSSYHDVDDKKELDNYKKDFWNNIGYSFYSPDIRNYTILEMIQIFFPQYEQIPDYIDYSYGQMCDCNLIQSYLNNGKTISEIVQLTKYTKSCIQGLISRKIIYLPDGYKENVYNIKKIVQLDKDYHYINTFNSYKDLDKHGYANGTIRRVLNGTQKYSYGFIWMFEDDYNKLKIS